MRLAIADAATDALLGVVGITGARNTPSAPVMERAGMTRSATRDVVFNSEHCTE